MAALVTLVTLAATALIALRTRTPNAPSPKDVSPHEHAKVVPARETSVIHAERHDAGIPSACALLVLTSDRRPLPAHAFAHHPAANVAADDVLWESSADDQGWITLPPPHNPEADVNLTVTCAGHVPATLPVTEARAMKTIVLQPAAGLHVRIVDLYGTPLPDVLVGISNGHAILTEHATLQTGAEDSLATARTDSSGSCRFSAIRPDVQRQLHLLDERLVIVRGDTLLPPISSGTQHDLMLEVGVLMVALLRCAPDRPEFIRVMPVDALHTADSIMPRVIRRTLATQRHFPDCRPVLAIARDGRTRQTSFEIGMGESSGKLLTRAVVSASSPNGELVPQDVSYTRVADDLATLVLVVTDPTGYAIPQQRLVLQPTNKGAPRSVLSNRPHQLPPGRYLIRGRLSPELGPIAELPKEISLNAREERTLRVPVQASMRPVRLIWNPPTSVTSGVNTELSWGPDAEHMQTIRSMNPDSATILMPTGWMNVSIHSAGRSWSGRIHVESQGDDEAQAVHAELR